MSTNGPTLIEKLIRAIETANELDFDTSFAKSMREGNFNDPTSAYLLDNDGQHHLWLNFGFPAKDLTVEVVDAITPALQKAQIEQFNFPGESEPSDSETPAMKKLLSLAK